MSWMEIVFHPLIKINNNNRKKNQTKNPQNKKNELHKTEFRRKSKEEIWLAI